MANLLPRVDSKLMLRPRKERRGNNFYCAIDMTAFAAIVVVLLGMFMIRALPHSDTSGTISVNLPRVLHPTAQQKANREDAIHIGVTHDGKLYFKRLQVSSLKLPELISQSVQEGAERKAYISADARASYGFVVQALEAVREAGIEEVVFTAAEQRQ